MNKLSPGKRQLVKNSKRVESMKILLNQIGYIKNDAKKVIVQVNDNESFDFFEIFDVEEKEVLCRAPLTYCGPVAKWNTGNYYIGYFSDFTQTGSFKIKVDGKFSEIFEITEYLVNLRLINANTYFFKAQRSTGEWLNEDRHLSFRGPRKGTMDLHGGWFDASGDHGIHLSHLSHSTYYNPQQTGFSVYAFYKAYEFIKEKKYPSYEILAKRMIDEGSWGADFLMRLHAPSGSFIRSIRREEDLNHMDEIKGTRGIGFEYHSSSDQFSAKASTSDVESVDDTNYEASLRSGGAMAIAALAIASKYESSSYDYTEKQYLQVAGAVYAYLRANNEKYTNDGKWNFVDYFTTLIASVELYRATGEEFYLDDARRWADFTIASTLKINGNEARFEYVSGMPYHHASDEGLPIVALLSYMEIENNSERRNTALGICEDVMRHKMKISNLINNPFDYPLEEVLQDGKVKTQFFFPHKTTVSPWWQGEDARLASISTASSYLERYTEDSVLKEYLRSVSCFCLDWIMGQNPFDASMIEGFGRNNPQYFFYEHYDYLNCPGGIVNGVTSGIEDEESIDFVTEPRDGITDNWRWAEQWIPHVSWFILAKSIKKE